MSVQLPYSLRNLHAEIVRSLHGSHGKMTVQCPCDFTDTARAASGNLSLRLPPGLTGADISSLVSEAAMAAIRRAVDQIERGGRELEAAEVSQQDFLEALQNIRPSVSPAEMRDYELLRENLRK